MAEKTLNTRIKLKYDTASNWAKTSVADKGANFIPKAGEVCFVQVNDSVASAISEVTFKVGDGVHKFSELPYASGKASDVYAWAKAAGIVVEDAGDGALIAKIEWKDNKLVITRTNRLGSTANGAVEVGDGVKVYQGLSIKSGSLYVDDGATIVGGINNGSGQVLTIPDGTAGGTNTIALTSDIPTELKNPSALNLTIAGYNSSGQAKEHSTSYDGAAAKGLRVEALTNGAVLGWSNATSVIGLTDGAGNTVYGSVKLPTPDSAVTRASSNYPSSSAVANWVDAEINDFADRLETGSYPVPYSAITGTPDINDGTLTIKAEGTSKGAFTANQKGNTEIDLKASDFGLSSALKFIGTSTTAISDGQTVGEITLSDGTKITPTIGNVVLYNHKEFIVTNVSKWEELGDESSHALKTVKITGTGVLSGGGSLEASREITHNKIAVARSAQTAALTPGEQIKLVRSISDDGFGHVNAIETDYLTLPGFDAYNFKNYGPTLEWGKTVDVGTAGDITYSVTMPANPNTHYATGLYVGASNAKANAAATSPYIKLYDDSTRRAEFQIKGGGGTTVSSDANGNITITSSSFTLPVATSTALGGVKLGSDTVQSVAANAVSSTASRTYAVQANSSGQLVANVPWISTEFSNNGDIKTSGQPSAVDISGVAPSDDRASDEYVVVYTTANGNALNYRLTAGKKVVTTDDMLVLDGGSSTVNI